MLKCDIYTVYRKKVVCLIFGHNFFEYRPIFKILSLTDTNTDTQPFYGPLVRDHPGESAPEK